jgi:nicotinamide riboside kinase
MSIELGPKERELLGELLEKELEEVRSELHHTQAHGYKETLKEREQLVRELLAKLGG